MTEDRTLVYKIGMVGPPRVGKTSLISAFLHDGRRLLEGTRIALNAVGGPTQKRLGQHRRELDGALLAGEFEPQALGGSQDAFIFRLMLDPGVAGAGIELQILDYPGGWMDPVTRAPEVEAQWRECEEFLSQCSVLIVPTDAAVLMEATESRHKREVPRLLATPEVDDLVRNWLIQRNRRPDEPALLMFCPVKCESYFTDNGGRSDKSEELYQWVLKAYQGLVEAVPNEAASVRSFRSLYSPVDTIGCVEILRAEWNPEPGDPTALNFSAHYGVRPPGQRSIKGADDLMIALCRQLVGGRQQVEEREAEQKARAASAAQSFAERDEGFFRNIWVRLNGERRVREEAAAQHREEAVEAAELVKALTAVVDDLAARPHGKRVRRW